MSPDGLVGMIETTYGRSVLCALQFSDNTLTILDNNFNLFQPPLTWRDQVLPTESFTLLTANTDLLPLTSPLPFSRATSALDPILLLPSGTFPGLPAIVNPFLAAG